MNCSLVGNKLTAGQLAKSDVTKSVISENLPTIFPTALRSEGCSVIITLQQVSKKCDNGPQLKSI